MKQYRGMYKMYFDIKGGMGTAAEKAEEIRKSPSAINLENDIHGAAAFIVYCDEMLAELYSIRTMSEKINTLAYHLPHVARVQFIRQALIEEIHQTNEMENVHSTRKEIKDEMMVIENGKKGKRFDGMIRKYQLLIPKDDIPLLSCQDIRELYDSFVLDEVLKEDPNDAPDGVYFRSKMVSVVKNSAVIHEGIYPESALNKAMELALSFLNNDELDPLIRTSAFHYLFGYIHPFYNGNGRMTRFISSYMLSRNGIHTLVALRLSYVIKNNRSKYYSLFKNTNDKRNFGDLTCFVIGFLDFVNEACHQVLDFLSEKNKMIDHYRQLLDTINAEDKAKELLFVLIQTSICDGDSLSIKELSAITQNSAYLVNKYLAQVSEYCSLSKIGTYKCYRANLESLEIQTSQKQN